MKITRRTEEPVKEFYIFNTLDRSWKTNMNFSKLLLWGIELKETQESHKELYLM